MKFNFRNNFLTGLVVILPFTLTIFILLFFIKKLNALLLEPIISLFGPHIFSPIREFLGKLAIFFILILGVWLIGLLARILFIRKAFGFLERIFLKVPMFSLIYKGIKEMSTAFIGERKTAFNRVVLIEYPRKGIFSIGFLTSDYKGEVQKKAKSNLISVFVPTTPNPTSGMFILVPVEEAIPLDMSVADGMKLIISGGAVQLPFKTNEKQNLEHR